MLELLADPNAIQFAKKQKISLPLLKNQIDRRIIKIQLMIQQVYPHQSHSLTSRQQANKAIQVNLDRTSLELVQQPSNQACHETNKPIQLQNGYTFRGKRGHSFSIKTLQIKREQSISEVSRKTQIYNNFRQKFSCHQSQINVNQLQLLSVLKNSRAAQIEELALQFSKVKFNEDISYDEQVNSIKQQIRKRLSHSNAQAKNNSASFTERPLREKRNVNCEPKSSKKEVYIKPQLVINVKKQKCVKRVVVSQNMFLNMHNQILTKLSQKKSYYSDNNIRNKILSKIQQKHNISLF